MKDEIKQNKGFSILFQQIVNIMDRFSNLSVHFEYIFL